MTCYESKRINNAKKFPYLDDIHPDDRADYLAGKYTKADKMRFLCDVCGEYYEQSPKERQKGHGHAACSHKQRGISQRIGEDYHSFADLSPEYQEKCRNKELTSKDQVDFICNVCGKTYSTLLGSHEQGACCGSCASKTKRLTCQPRKDYDFLDDVCPIDRGKIQRGELNNQSKVRIKCLECGEYFSQVLLSRELGFTRCKDCASKENGKALRRRDYDFINPMREDYAKALANGELCTQDRAIFVCPVHGEYEQIIMSAQTHGCQACTMGLNPHSFYEFLLTITNNIIVNDRQQIAPKEIDFYLPDCNIGFEFNDIATHQTLFSEQESNQRNWGGKPQTYHHNKFIACKEQGVRLFQIWDIEWNNERIRPILESVIRNALGLNEHKVYARKCELVKSNSKECNPFFIENHIQGAAKGNGYYALKYDGEIVGAICYTKKIKLVSTGNNNNADVTISRMCFKRNTSVVGGASRLLKAVTDTMRDGQSIEYLVLNDYFDGVSFETTGWENAKWYSMVRYYDKEKDHSHYRDPHKYKERKEMCLNGKMCRYFTSGTTVYRKTKAPS